MSSSNQHRVPWRAILVGLLALVFLAGCGAAKYTPKANEELYGTWKQANAKMNMDREVWDATAYSVYLHAQDTDAFFTATYTIARKWTASDGSIRYEISGSYTGGTGIGGFKGKLLTAAVKIYNSGSTLEDVWSQPTSDQEMKNPRYPDKIDESNSSYGIWSRVTK